MTGVKTERGSDTERSEPSDAILWIACAASFMVVLDTTIVNIALPSIRQSLDLSPTGQQWIVNSYILTFGGFLLLGGRAGDVYGRRRTFLTGLSIFTFASLAGGLAPNGVVLICARSLQGFGGAVLSPSTLGLLSNVYSAPNRRNRAFAIWNAFAAAGAAAGIVLGGLLTGVFGWRAVLFVNVPVGLCLLAAAPGSLYKKAEREPGAPPLDYAGAVTVTLAASVLVYAVVTTASNGWTSLITITMLAVAAALCVLFVAIESRVPAPLVPLSFFRNRTASSVNACAVLLGIVGISSNYFASLYLQNVRGETPVQAGLILMPSAFGAILGALVMGRIGRRIGTRYAVAGGALIAACGQLALSRSSVSATPLLLLLTLPAMVTSTGSGVMYVPLTMAATSSVGSGEAGLAAGMISTARQIGAAVGLAVFVTVAAGATAAAAGPHMSPRALLSGYDLAFRLDAGVSVALALAALTLLERHLGRGGDLPVAPVRSAGRDEDLSALS
jgi:EmrB/QacA subfamily drug resistance transporter